LSGCISDSDSGEEDYGFQDIELKRRNLLQDRAEEIQRKRSRNLGNIRSIEEKSDFCRTATSIKKCDFFKKIEDCRKFKDEPDD